MLIPQLLSLNILDFIASINSVNLRLLRLYQSARMLSLGYAYPHDTFKVYQLGLSLGSNFIQDFERREYYLKNFFIRRAYMFWTYEVPKSTTFLQKLGIRLMPEFCDKGIAEIEGWYLRIQDKAEDLLNAEIASALQIRPLFMLKRELQCAKWTKFPRRSLTQISYQSSNHILAVWKSRAICSATAQQSLIKWRHTRISVLRAFLSASSPSTLANSLTYPLPAGQEPNLPNFKAVDGLPPGGQPRLTPFHIPTLLTRRL